MDMILTKENDSIENRIEKFLNNVLYIDDNFNIEMDALQDPETIETISKQEGTEEKRQEDKKHIEGNVLYFQSFYNDEHAATNEPQNVLTNEYERPEKEDIEATLEDIQKMNPEVKVFPFKYSNTTDIKTLRNHIDSSQLTIIDWSLNEKIKASNIIKDLIKDTDKLYLFVVYSKQIDEAEKNFKAIFENKLEIKEEIISPQKKYKYFMVNENALIMLCAKQSMKISEIIGHFSKLIIKHFGYFPIVFLDTIQKLNAKTGKLLKKFAHPFESLLILQLNSSDYKYEDLPDILSNMVTTHLYEEIKVDTDIIDKIYITRINKLKQLAELREEELRSKVISVIGILIDKGFEAKGNVELLSLIDMSVLKFCLQWFNCEPHQWNRVIEIMIKRLSKEIIKVKVDKELLEIKSIQTLDDKFKSDINVELIKKFKKLYETETIEWVKQLLPTFITILCDNTMSNSIVDLINVLKLHKYENMELDKLIDSCIVWDIKNDEKIFDETNSKSKLKNLFHTGDILVNGNNYLLCITPPCDVFRPSKVDYKLSFIKGVSCSSIPIGRNKRESSEHITIIPFSDFKKLVCIKWQCFDTIIINLSEEKNVSELKKYIRPYRLGADYTRQIVNKYTSYYSRAGVEELFIKDSPGIGNMFLK